MPTIHSTYKLVAKPIRCAILLSSVAEIETGKGWRRDRTYAGTIVENPVEMLRGTCVKPNELLGPVTQLSTT